MVSGDLDQLMLTIERDFKIAKYYLNALLNPNEDYWLIKHNESKQVDVLEEQKAMYDIFVQLST